MRVIVTRPLREAQRWVQDLTASGLQAQALPLIKVGPVDDTTAVVQAWQRLADYVGVMFVSGNAAEHFFASKKPLAPVFTAQAAIKTRAWATGPGTARALLRLGVAPDFLDAPSPDVAQFDSEALWQVVAPQVQPGTRVLIVRGADTLGSDPAGQGSGREWFAKRVAQAGAQVDFVVAYQRCAPDFHAPEAALAQAAATDGSVWLFSSSEAVANLQDLLPDQAWSGARALATHPRIAAAARKIGFLDVAESRPTLSDVVASLNSTL
ncbi:MAG: uroporphyrinogen-III synthase [Rhodoferax sp.]|uniref:uroporphyrinogen-III synthase n=1 Tax=Rhodoferax sp. TaxID=50421 RepID=UPI0030176758